MSLLQDLLKETPLSGALKERVTIIEKNYEHANREIEGYKQRIAALERENETLRSHAPIEPPSTLGSDTTPVLVHLYKAAELGDKEVGAMAAKLNMERSVLQYHLHRLKATGLGAITSGNYIDGNVYWALTPAGRRYVEDNKLG